MKSLLVCIMCLSLSGCFGLTGTRISVQIPNGPTLSYETDSDKEYEGITVDKRADGQGWTFTLDKVKSDATEIMAEAVSKLVDKLPLGTP